MFAHRGSPEEPVPSKLPKFCFLRSWEALGFLQSFPKFAFGVLYLESFGVPSKLPEICCLVWFGLLACLVGLSCWLVLLACLVQPPTSPTGWTDRSHRRVTLRDRRECHPKIIVRYNCIKRETHKRAAGKNERTVSNKTMNPTWKQTWFLAKGMHML